MAYLVSSNVKDVSSFICDPYKNLISINASSICNWDDFSKVDVDEVGIMGIMDVSYP